jgi:2-polyprenyl-6-methoxyphenol hydroxylase-like FAD-dependent oxidoreductase
MRQDHAVLIAGAGPTGLALAIELKRMGLPVRLIDKADQPVQHSQALVVQARTLEQFERYGIADKAVALGRKILRATAFSEGKKIVSFELDRIPGRYPYVLFLAQSDTERLLTEHLRSLGCEIERGTELLSFENTKDGVTAQLRHHSGATQSVPAPWLVGCDGAHSVVRKGMNVSFEGDTVGLDFLLGDFELTGPDVPGDELMVHLHRGDVVFVGRLSDTLHRVIVALHPEDGTQPPAGREPGIADFQAAIDRAGVHITVQSPAWISPFHINQRKAGNYRAGSAFLAGDAAHIHSPVAGQGMNTGIQDTANLAWKLAAVADGAGDELLDTYDEERGAVGEALLKITSRGLSVVTTANPILERIRDLIVPALTGFESIQNILAGFVSETAIEYRGSSIVADYGGDGSLCAGDRVPNAGVEFTGGKFERLLDPLKSGRALALGIGVGDLRRIRARLPHADVIELRGASGMLGTELEGGAAAGHHSVGSEFPAAAAVNAATAAAAAAAFSAAGALRTYGPPPSVSAGGPAPRIALLTAELAGLFGGENRIIVIRPDGYLGFRGSLEDLARLDDYARLTALS